MKKLYSAFSDLFAIASSIFNGADSKLYSEYKAKLHERQLHQQYRFLLDSDKPFLLLGGGGSGKSTLLLEVARQSMLAGKSVFHFTLTGNRSCDDVLFNSAVNAGCADRYYINNYFHPRNYGISPDTQSTVHELLDIERPNWTDVLCVGGSVSTCFDGLETMRDEYRNDVNSKIRECISAIICHSENLNKISLIIDDGRLIDIELLEKITALSKSGVSVFVGLDSIANFSPGSDKKFMLDRSNLYLMRSYDGIQIASTLSELGISVSFSDLCNLQAGEGFQLSMEAPTQCIFHKLGIGISMEKSHSDIKCANARTIAAKSA